MPPVSSSSPQRFLDRIDAGEQLAQKIRPHVEQLAPDDIVVVGLARGGVIVAAEIAQQLDARLEAMVVRKLGAPSQPELAIGALTAHGDTVFNPDLIREIGLSEEHVQSIVHRSLDAARILSDEIGTPVEIPDIEGKTVILVDDGVATGATMRVAIKTAYKQGAQYVIVALPVAPASALRLFRELADDLVTIIAPTHLRAVGEWYESFLDVPSEQVRKTLETRPRHQMD